MNLSDLQSAPTCFRLPATFLASVPGPGASALTGVPLPPGPHLTGLLLLISVTPAQKGPTFTPAGDDTWCRALLRHSGPECSPHGAPRPATLGTRRQLSSWPPVVPSAQNCLPTPLSSGLPSPCHLAGDSFTPSQSSVLPLGTHLPRQEGLSTPQGKSCMCPGHLGTPCAHHTGTWTTPGQSRPLAPKLLPWGRPRLQAVLSYVTPTVLFGVWG